jgi:hypothetical protein
MRVSIMQPAFLPWLGYFNRIVRSDIHIYLDNVNLDSNSKTKFTNRNKIRTPEGWIWLTVPLQTKGLHGRAIINSLKIAGDSAWADKMWRSIEANYKRTPYFAQYAPAVETALKQERVDFGRMVNGMTATLLRLFEIDQKIIFSSDLSVVGAKDELVVNLCKQVGATSYISGPLGREYLIRKKFDEAGIELLFHDYKHPQYPQAFSGFQPYMSAIDLLFNVGPDSLRILREETAFATE